MKRALKKREKAVLESTQSEEVPVEQQNLVNLRIHRLVPTKAAMIGLAISMGATSFLVTRQSDQALAAEPIGNQNTASTIPAAADAELKLAPTNHLESNHASLVGQPENPVLVEQNAISQVPGLGTKWQIVTSRASTPISVPVAVPTKLQMASSLTIPVVDANQQTAKQQLEKVQTFSSAYGVVGNQTASFAAQPQTVVDNDGVKSEVTAQLKAQQEFALNRLQQKSDRLRASLAELRAEQTTQFPKLATIENQSTIPQINTSSTFAPQTEASDNANQASLVSRLKQRTAVNLPTHKIVTPVVTPTAATPQIVTPTLSAKASYEVKPGDTLAAIAHAHSTSVSEIVKANHLTNPNQLQINQKLSLPNTVVNNIASQAPVAVNSNTFELGSNPTVNNTIPSNTTVIQPLQANTVNSTAATDKTEAVSTVANPYGMGGDNPIPTAITEMQLARQNVTKSKNHKSANPRLNSLKAEIEKLREKYRAQQSGSSVVAEDTDNTNDYSTATQIPVTQPNSVAIPIPVFKPINNVAVTTPITKANPLAVSIPVPQPKGSVYNSFKQNNELVNPEFLPKAQRKIQVNTELPPLAAVDTYLPKPIEEITPTAKGYIWPAKGVMTSGYGWRWGRMHKGIDIANGVGTAIYASSSGVVEKAGWNSGGYGNVVDIRHADGSLTRYAHNSKLLVRKGQQVEQGEIIAAMGNTGFSTGPHSHFEIHPAGKGAVNPMAFLPERV